MLSEAMDRAFEVVAMTEVNIVGADRKKQLLLYLLPEYN